MDIKTDRKVIRVRGKLKEIITLKDHRGNVLQRMISPMMVEFYPRDLMQIIVGASILAVPVAFTEETWNLGSTLPLSNVIFLMLISVLFISAFVYYNFYRSSLKRHIFEFLKRIASVYIFSFIVVTLILILIQRAPWSVDWLLALKRTIIVAFPASMSAAVADMMK